MTNKKIHSRLGRHLLQSYRQTREGTLSAIEINAKRKNGAHLCLVCSVLGANTSVLDPIRQTRILYEETIAFDALRANSAGGILSAE